MNSENSKKYSFRNNVIPKLPNNILKRNRTLSTEEAVESYMRLSDKDAHDLTIKAVHYDDKSQLDTVMLTDGSVITVETAIAFAENNLINGYTTGTTRYGGKTLRTKKQGVSLKSLQEF